MSINNFKVNIKWLIALFILLLSAVVRIVPPVFPESGLVFDESYFVGQTESYAVERYYFDPHPPLGKLLLLQGLQLLNPDAATKLDPEKLANQVSNYTSPLDLDGIRLFPRIFGTVFPVIVFLVCWEMLARGRKQPNLVEVIAATSAGALVALENTFIVESRYALLAQFMQVFMFAALWAAIKLRYSHTKFGQEIWVLVIALFLGLAISVKWLAFGIFPAVGLLILLKLRELYPSRQQWKQYLAQLCAWLGTIGLIMATIYIGVFVWHFQLMRHYAPAADEVSLSHRNDLLNGTRNTSFIDKFIEWHQLSNKYQQYVPQLDYNKSDEIGSWWYEWPLMSRPIFFYWQSYPDGTYAFIYLYGNPVVWIASLAGIIGIVLLILYHLFKRRFITEWQLILLITFLANFLPFAWVMRLRVMYLYHYLPALMVGVIAFAYLLPKLLNLLTRWSAGIKLKGKRFAPDQIQVSLFGLIILVIMVGFLFASPLTYLVPINREQFKQRELTTLWNMKWPGDQ